MTVMQGINNNELYNPGNLDINRKIVPQNQSLAQYTQFTAISFCLSIHKEGTRSTRYGYSGQGLQVIWESE